MPEARADIIERATPNAKDSKLETEGSQLIYLERYSKQLFTRRRRLLIGGTGPNTDKRPLRVNFARSLEPLHGSPVIRSRQFRHAAVGQLPHDNLPEDLAAIGAQQTHVLLSSSESRAVATVLESCRLGDIPLRRFFRLLLKDPVLDYATSLLA